MNAAETPAFAELSGVSHSYRGSTALDGIDLILKSGQLCGAIGPDGVGKSTLLGLVAGVRRIQRGRVRVLGNDLDDSAQRAATLPRLAYLPQGLGRNLYPTLSVYENIDFFGRLFGQDARTRRERIADLTAATGLGEFVERPAMHLSGGMKQKLGLCCALIHEPDLLILDEPTTGIDPLSRRRFWEIIERLRRRRPTINMLISTAYMDEAERFDHLVAMHAGQVLAAGSAQALRQRTNESEMESVFIALLPEARRRGHRRPVIPPHVGDREAAPAIRCRQLTRRFGDFTAVDRVTLEIRKGEIFGFLGSNGSGKTTTMRMLTGLLPISEGQAWVFGKPVDHSDPLLRRRLGFMSQSFSLYEELSVRQNLGLHARLFGLPPGRRRQRMLQLTEQFELERYQRQRAGELPLGVRQRLSLAVAMIHEPELLILDEPTSGVDPVARDGFWSLLAELSRKQGVTIFISTHFMNEAERCDRISLMHAGRMLAQGTPDELRTARASKTLEECFIACIEQEAPSAPQQSIPDASQPTRQTRPPRERTGRFSAHRVWAYAQREAMELRRDPIRLAFALLGSLLLMFAMGFGISFDVKQVRYAVLDYDRSPESRAYLEHFAGSNHFEQRSGIRDDADLLRRLRANEITLAIEVPAGFGRRLRGGDRPEVGFWIDGGVPFRGDTIQGYVQGVHRLYLQSPGVGHGSPTTTAPPVSIETRFRYNQSFKSVYAIVPGVMMLLLIMIPATMTAVGVVREKELGSITNYYATPTTGAEFLLGKQLPYVVLALLSYLILLLEALLLFGVSMRGSLTALSLGALLFVFSSTGLGLLMSTFMRTQLAAVFATAIASVIPTILFSGMLVPVSALQGSARIMGYGFPSAWFNHISIGAFTKGLGLQDLWLDYQLLALFGLGFFLLSCWLLPGRER